jgi:hypothetical protein
MWDYTIWADSLYKKLATKAISLSLTPNELPRLIEAFKCEPELAIEYGLTPNVFPSICETYPELAFNLMIALNSNPRISEYYYSLFVQIQLSQQQKTVFFMLKERVEIPMLYIIFMIAQGIETCLNSKKKQERVFYVIIYDYRPLI